MKPTTEQIQKEEQFLYDTEIFIRFLLEGKAIASSEILTIPDKKAMIDLISRLIDSELEFLVRNPEMYFELYKATE